MSAFLTAERSLSHLLARRVGIGHRPEIATDLLMAPQTVGFVEVVAETCFSQRATRVEVAALAEMWPVVPHGVKLSLGTAGGVDRARVDRLGALARELRAPCVSEHVAMTRGPNGREIGHLTQLPRTRAAVSVLARNVADARRRLPDVPLLLENVAWSALWPEDEMDEGTFYQEVMHATSCPLLLDVGNLYANAVNEGREPAAVLESYPLDSVAMIHVAGGVLEEGFYFDTHAHPIPAPVLDLVAMVLAKHPNVPVLIERDANFGAFGELTAELERIRALRPATRESATAAFGPRPALAPTPLDDAAASAYSARQNELAHLLTDVAAPAGPSAEAFGISALKRARGILERKRVDDALPLLGNLARRLAERSALRDLAESAMRARVRPPRGAGPADALAIATAVASETRDARMRDEALRDRLLLRARFVGPDRERCVRPRVAPFVGRETLSDGTTIRAIKTFGPFASVHTSERKNR